MKKLILFSIVFIISLEAFSQDKFFVSAGVDPKLLINGAYEHDKSPAIDLIIKFGTQTSKGLEFGLSFEYAKLKPYYFSYGAFSNYVLSNKKETLKYAAGIELLCIDRGYNKVMQTKALDVVVSYGFNAEIRIKTFEGFYTGFLLNATHRKDLKEMYNDNTFLKTSGFVRFIYEIKM